MLQSTEGILSPEEIVAYRRDGYIVPRLRLEGDDLAGLQEAVSHLVEDNPTLLDQSIVGPHVELWSKVGDGVDQEGGISWG